MRYFFLVVLIFPCWLHAQIVTTVAGCNGCIVSGDGGPATATLIGYFAGIAINDSGDIFIADGDGNRVRKVDGSTGIITTIAGTGIAGYDGDNIPATAARLNGPQFVACDTSGNLFISEPANRRIRKVDKNGVITTFAGNGSMGGSGDNGPATNATLTTPQGLVFDASGNLYVADIGSGKVRKIDIHGIITHVAGSGSAGFSGDNGVATLAELNNPQDVAIDREGNLLIADRGNNRIRKVDFTVGTISTIAGYSAGGYDGDGHPATSSLLAGPWGVVASPDGGVYIADNANNRVRKVDAFGIIQTVVGNGTPGYSGDNDAAVLARINRPEGVRLDKCGNLYVADFNNSVIRKISFNPECWPVGIKETRDKDVLVYPNPTRSELHIDATHGEENYKIYSVAGSKLQQGVLRKGDNTIDVRDLPAGMYMVEITGNDGKRTVKKIIRQ